MLGVATEGEAVFEQTGLLLEQTGGKGVNRAEDSSPGGT